MTKSELALKIIEINDDDDSGEKAEFLLEELIAQDPTDIDLWMRLAILEIKPPIVDYFRNFAYLEHVLKLSPQNPKALLCLAYSHVHDYIGMPDDVFLRLKAIKTDSNELNSMFKYAMSWYYQDKNDFEQQEKLLNESINYYQEHVWNYVNLARCYIKKNKIIEAHQLVEKALKNVKNVQDPETGWRYDYTDVDEYINERVKGISQSFWNFESLKKMVLD